MILRHMSTLVLTLSTCLVVAACGDDAGSGPAVDASPGSDAPISAPSLVGTWIVCWLDGANDLEETVVATATTIGDTGLSFPSSDASCTGGPGTPAPAVDFSGTYVVGNPVSTTLGGAPVTAYELDITTTGGTGYSIFYIDTGLVPNQLYLGDDSGANDGSTVALRPTTLKEAKPLDRQ